MSTDTVDFVWDITPPELVNGQRVQRGDTQRLPRDQAERYELMNYGRVGKPAKHVEKIITVRMRQNYPSQIWTADGARINLKRGDVIQMEEVQGLQLVVIGLATQDLTSDMDDLPLAVHWEDAPEAVAARKHPALVAAMERQRPPKVGPTQEQIDYRNQQEDERRRRIARTTGWSR